MDRRTMLSQLAAGVALAGRPLSRVLAAEPPAVEVIDTHTHFYDPTRPEGVPWPSKDSPLLYRPVLPDEFTKLTTPLGVTGTVVVEASPWLEDNAWLLGLADRHPQAVVGIVGNLRPGTAGFGEHLARFAKHPLYRGFRIPGREYADKLDQPEVLADFRRVQDANLSVDVNGGPDMLPVVRDLAMRLPDLRIVVNHLANTGITPQGPDETWAADLAKLSPCPNVFLKVSALMESAGRNGPAPKDPEFYRPWLDHCWRVFGPERLIYGSNWPVSLRAGSYAEGLAIVQAYWADRSETERRAFFADNAARAYRWVRRPA